MKALKICSFLTVVILISSVVSNSIAQTFENEESDETYVTPRQQLIIELLRTEIKDRPEFKEYVDVIDEQLDMASEYDSIGEECYKYSPLLVDALDLKARFLDFFYIQGNFKYSFYINGENAKTTEAFNFYEWYEDGKMIGLLSSVTIEEHGSVQHLEDKEAMDYISKHYCQPLNQILDQNKNMPVPQLLEVLRQRFSK